MKVLELSVLKLTEAKELILQWFKSAKIYLNSQFPTSQIIYTKKDNF